MVKLKGAMTKLPEHKQTNTKHTKKDVTYVTNGMFVN